LKSFYGTTVLELIEALASVDGRDQVYTVLDDDGDAVTTGTTVVDHDFEFHVLAEDEETELTYTIGFEGNPENTDIDAVEDVEDILWIDGDLVEREVYVRPGTLQATLLSAFEPTNEDYPAAISIVNSELAPKAANALSTGDKVLVTAVDGTKDVWVVVITPSDDVEIEFDGDAVVTDIEVPWNFEAAEVLALVTSANGEVQSYELQVDVDGTWEEYDAADEDHEALVQDGTFRVLVIAEDETEVPYDLTVGFSSS